MKLHERLKVIRASRLAPSERHLITVIACYLGEKDDGPAFPSVTTMAKETGYAESQVHNLLRSMLASGLITRVDGGRRALLTCIRWDAVASHVAAPSGRGGARAKAPKTGPQTPKTGPIDDAAALDDGCRDWCHEGAETGGEGAEFGATPAKTAPDQIMISSEIRPEEQTMSGREPDPTLLRILLASQRSHPMRTVTPDSRPTMPTDAIDNVGEDTSPPLRPTPSPSTDDAAPATTAATAPPASGPVSNVAPAVDPTQASAFTLEPKPPTSRKRKASSALDLEAWGKCCQAYDVISGKMRRWDPAKGDGRLIAETMAAQGQARIVARFAQAARDPWCLDKHPDVSALCRAGSDFVRKLDAAAEQAALDAESRSDASQAVVGVVGRLDPQNRSQGQAAPKQDVPWSDVLRDIGSDPQVHPEDGPHRHRWQSVRQAVIMAIRKPGDPWKAWCNADDPARQRVESLLERGLVK